MILLLIILIPTILITLKSITRFEKFNNLISRFLTLFIRVVVLVMIVYGVYHLITNWGNYDLKDISESMIIIFVTGILTGLLEKQLRKIEKENQFNRKGAKKNESQNK